MDCDDDGLIDECAITDGHVTDCNENGIPDSCDVKNPDGGKDDFNDNGIPDSWELAQGDLNLDGCINASDLGLLISNWSPCSP